MLSKQKLKFDKKNPITPPNTQTNNVSIFKKKDKQINGKKGKINQLIIDPPTTAKIIKQTILFCIIKLESFNAFKEL